MKPDHLSSKFLPLAVYRAFFCITVMRIMWQNVVIFTRNWKNTVPQWSFIKSYFWVKYKPDMLLTGLSDSSFKCLIKSIAVYWLRHPMTFSTIIVLVVKKLWYRYKLIVASLPVSFEALFKSVHFISGFDTSSS